MKQSDMVRVMNATVRMDGLKGQGVLVPGGYILTACACRKSRTA